MLKQLTGVTVKLTSSTNPIMHRGAIGWRVVNGVVTVSTEARDVASYAAGEWSGVDFEYLESDS